MGFVRRVITSALDLANLAKHNANFADIETDLTAHDGRLGTVETEQAAQSERIDNIVASGGESNIEIVDAREDYGTLRERLDTEHSAVTTQLAETDVLLSDLTVFVRKFKTSSNTWNEALQLATDYANSIFTSQSEIGGVYVPQNVVVKMPRGRYLITQVISGKQGVNYDFTGCTFVANPSNKTLIFLDMTDLCFRNEYIKGTFIGFHTAALLSTGNLDTANIVWDSPTFQSCFTGIDTVSFAKSRSTFLLIKNIYSIKTDRPIKAHTDMGFIDGGWIYHTGYDGAAIYNQGFIKMSNVICVPAAAQSGARPRWIDNYSSDAGVDSQGERGISLDHIRFGGETGSCPIIFNYATNDVDAAVYKATVIDINECIINSVGTVDQAAIVLFALPNRISIKNCSGFTNLTNGLIHCDSSFNSTTVPNSRYISIDIDNTGYASPSFPLIDSDLYRFLKTKENLNSQFRNTFVGGKTHLKYIPSDGGLDGSRPLSNFSIKVNTPVIDNAAYGEDYGLAFLLIVDGIESGGGTYTYKTNAVYYVAATGGFTTQKVKRLNFTKLAGFNGGISFGVAPDLKSVLWETTGSIDVPIENNENIKISAYGHYTLTSAIIVPLFGNTIEVA